MEKRIKAYRTVEINTKPLATRPLASSASFRKEKHNNHKKKSFETLGTHETRVDIMRTPATFKKHRETVVSEVAVSASCRPPHHQGRPTGGLVTGHRTRETQHHNACRVLTAVTQGSPRPNSTGHGAKPMGPGTRMTNFCVTSQPSGRHQSVFDGSLRRL